MTVSGLTKLNVTLIGCGKKALLTALLLGVLAKPIGGL